VNGVTGVGVTTLSVNPGQAATFPLLSKKCSNQFEKYHFMDLEFYYMRMVSEFATNGSQGKVILAFNHDAADAPPATQQQLEDFVPPNRADGMPCTPEIRIKLRPLDLSRQDSFYIRPAGLPGSTDIKTYDVGNLFIGVVGCANTSQIGEIRCRYKIRFIDPVLENLASAPINNSASWFQSTTAETGGATTVDKTLLLATTSANALSIVNTSGSFVPPSGNYLVDGFCSFANTELANSAYLQFKKNGVSVFTAGPPAFSNSNGDDGFLSFSVLVAANGTDAFTMVANSTYPAGAATLLGSLRWMSI